MHIQPHFYNQQNHKLYTTHHIISPPETGSSSSQGFMPLCYGSLAKEKSFMECSISPGDSRVAGGTYHNFRSWVGIDSYFLDKTNTEYEIPEEADDDRGELSAQIETLPLFPIHGGTTTGGGNHPDIFNVKAARDSSSEHSNGGYYAGGNWFRSDGRTSLEHK